MEILIKAAQFFLSISLLVIFHELGHYAFARLFKTRVEKFYLFFDLGFSLFKFKRGETEYGIGWLPLGGYVKISGMIDESMDKEQMQQPPQDYEFRSKPAWQRLLIMTGGVLVNFVLAVLIYVMILFVWGKEYLPAENAKYGIVTDSLGLNLGLQNGDKIVAVGGKKVDDFNKIIPEILLANEKKILIERQGQTETIEFDDKMIAKMIKHGRPFIMERIPFYVHQFTDQSSAKQAGVKPGDQLIGINDTALLYFDQYPAFLQKYKAQTVQLKIKRNNQEFSYPVEVSADGKLGIYPLAQRDKIFEIKKIEYSLIQSIPEGIKRGQEEINNYLKQFRLVFNSETEAYKSLGGFIAIGNIFPAEWNWYAFWTMTALLSIMLGVVNILPIPALDGGHVMFLFYEMITGRPPSDKFLERAQIFGMVILFALLIYANGNDIVKLFR